MKPTLMVLLASAVAACGQNYSWVNFAGLPGVPGDVDGATGTSRLSGTYGADCDNSGNIYVADRGNSKIKKITAGGVVSTLSASGFNLPTHVVVNKSNGNLYVADLGNGQIKKLVSPYSSETVIATITAIPVKCSCLAIRNLNRQSHADILLPPSPRGPARGKVIAGSICAPAGGAVQRQSGEF